MRTDTGCNLNKKEGPINIQYSENVSDISMNPFPVGAS
jgi:hypothetical protein